MPNSTHSILNFDSHFGSVHDFRSLSHRVLYTNLWRTFKMLVETINCIFKAIFMNPQMYCKPVVKPTFISNISTDFTDAVHTQQRGRVALSVDILNLNLVFAQSNYFNLHGDEMDICEMIEWYCNFYASLHDLDSPPSLTVASTDQKSLQAALFAEGRPIFSTVKYSLFLASIAVGQLPCAARNR